MKCYIFYNFKRAYEKNGMEFLWGGVAEMVRDDAVCADLVLFLEMDRFG